MEQIAVRQLNQDTAGVLARVERGEAVEITNRGRVIARIVPVEPGPLADLVAAGAATPPTITAPFALPKVAADAGAEGGRLLSDLRDEERW